MNIINKNLPFSAVDVQEQGTSGAISVVMMTEASEIGYDPQKKVPLEVEFAVSYITNDRGDEEEIPLIGIAGEVFFFNDYSERKLTKVMEDLDDVWADISAVFRREYQTLPLGNVLMFDLSAEMVDCAPLVFDEQFGLEEIVNCMGLTVSGHCIEPEKYPINYVAFTGSNIDHGIWLNKFIETKEFQLFPCVHRSPLNVLPAPNNEGFFVAVRKIDTSELNMQPEGVDDWMLRNGYDPVREMAEEMLRKMAKKDLAESNGDRLDSNMVNLNIPYVPIMVTKENAENQRLCVAAYNPCVSFVPQTSTIPLFISYEGTYLNYKGIRKANDIKKKGTTLELVGQAFFFRVEHTGEYQKRFSAAWEDVLSVFREVGLSTAEGVPDGNILLFPIGEEGCLYKASPELFDGKIPFGDFADFFSFGAAKATNGLCFDCSPMMFDYVVFHGDKTNHAQWLRQFRNNSSFDLYDCKRLKWPPEERTKGSFIAIKKIPRCEENRFDSSSRWPLRMGNILIEQPDTYGDE